MLPFLLPCAFAAVDVDEAHAMLVTLRPLVEREAGRRFDTLPALDIATTEEVGARLLAQRRAYGVDLDDPASADALAAAQEADRALKASSAAIYSPLDDIG